MKVEQTSEILTELSRATLPHSPPSISISFTVRWVFFIDIIFFNITIHIAIIVTTMIKGPNANKWSSSLTDSDLVKGTVVLVNMNVPRSS